MQAYENLKRKAKKVVSEQGGTVADSNSNSGQLI